MKTIEKNLKEQEIAKKVTLVGAGWDAILGLAKIIAGYLSQSQALIADGIHSLSDLVTDVFVYMAASNSHAAPDEKHPYGHRRFETLTTVFLGLVLIIVALGIALDTMINNSTPTVTWYGLAAIITTIIVKESIFHYTKKAGEAIGSKMLVANAWHSRSDALSSIAVLAGLGGVYIGWPWADKVASILVAILIGKIAIEMILENIAELVDTAPDKKVIEEITETANSLKNVMKPHDIRARSMAGKIHLDMHIHVPAYISVSEGHYISDKVIHTIKSKHAIVEDVLIHIDPEGVTHKGEKKTTAFHERDQIMADLGFLLRRHSAYLHLEKTRLHYFNSGLEIDLIGNALTVPEGTNLQKLTAGIEQDLSTLPYSNKKSIFWQF
ncbi:cation diffusion facilitator family transporter [Marinomonas sp. 15G1-11]|uniref:Cation diffusion facilitator family transporter n=1 Tax=Marinomonas phaeophyticola TaxID=3004091 RepID=A0ABT4JQV2_9GAMM|nr:cation diffusion facilitator family transporter [Marinomonas sp. 15G1-11]MCZ2720536.1 cation diffusion facilitator family transporter [Marinomonas sp. 15G1-11]